MVPSPRIPITIDTRYRYHARVGPFEHWPYGAPLHGHDLYAPQYRVSHVRNHKISLITIVAQGRVSWGRARRTWKDIITCRTLSLRYYTPCRGIANRRETIDRRDRSSAGDDTRCLAVWRRSGFDGDISCNAATYYSAFDWIPVGIINRRYCSLRLFRYANLLVIQSVRY